MSDYIIPSLPLPFKFESIAIYKQLSAASRALAELKGVAQTIPNENILLNTLVLQEAKDSSEVENIVTETSVQAMLAEQEAKNAELRRMAESQRGAEEREG